MKKTDNKNVFSTQPVNLKSTKNKFKKLAKSFMLLTSTLYAGLSGVPTEHAKSQADIINAVELLNAEENYFSFINTEVYQTTGKKLKEVKYIPLVLPKDTTQVKVILEDSFNSECEQAIKDSLEEYNSVLKAANQDWQFKYCGDYTLPDVCDIVVKRSSSESIGGIQLSAPLINGSKAFSQIFIDKAYDDYHNMLITFSHELMHYFGAGDLYALSYEEQQSIKSIMGVHSLTINALKENDIKYLFATLDSITNQDDVNRVNNYIQQHLFKYSYLNQQAENLKQQFGEDYLASQIKYYTNKDVTLNNFNTNEMYLIDKVDENTKRATIDSSIKCLSIGENSCSTFDILKEKLSLESKTSRQFLDENILFDCQDYYALFNKNGELINLFEPVTKDQFNSYYGKLYFNIEKSRQEDLTF